MTVQPRSTAATSIRLRFEGVGGDRSSKVDSAIGPMIDYRIPFTSRLAYRTCFHRGKLFCAALATRLTVAPDPELGGLQWLNDQ